MANGNQTHRPPLLGGLYCPGSKNLFDGEKIAILMHILIIGGKGQLGRALQAACTAPTTLSPATLSPAESAPTDIVVTSWSRPEHDITRPTIASQIAALQPDVVINAAAWTAVDAAEAEPDRVYAVNALGPKYIAEGCRACGAMMVQVSSNEVFAGEAGATYWEYDQPAPRSIYARSKLAGERATAHVLDRLFIVRTAWLFGVGGVNFPRKIMAAADEHGALRVVADERGNPSYAPDVAAAMIELLLTERFGIYHLVNEGAASRFEFAQAVLQATGRGAVPLTPIAHAEWQRGADSPLHAVLANHAATALGIQLRPWPLALQAYVATAEVSATTAPAVA